MKFLHMADMHFDSTFSILSAKGLGDKRRLEQREVFKRIIDKIIEEKIEYLFIAGDLYEHNQIRKSTMDFIKRELDRIPNVKIFITPGNHDPYVKGSFYDTYEFSDNVHIFKDKVEEYADENVKIYASGFTDFYMNENPIENLSIPYDSKPRILIAHASINGYKNKEGFSYNPILLSKLKELNLDYIALGHIHDKDFINEENICYSGSTMSLGFDELGEHGVIVGEIENKKLTKEFVKMDNRVFTEKEINVDNMYSNEDIVEEINGMDIKEFEMVKIVLNGNKNFDIDTRKIQELISNKNILKIKDQTHIAEDIEKLIAQNTLKGLYVKEVLRKYKQGEIDEENLEEIMQIGLDAMK